MYIDRVLRVGNEHKLHLSYTLTYSKLLVTEVAVITVVVQVVFRHWFNAIVMEEPLS